MSDTPINKTLAQQFKADIDKLEKELGAISAAVCQLKKSGVNIDVVAHIIQQSAKQHHTGTPISLKHIKFLLKGIVELEAYLKDPKGWE